MLKLARYLKFYKKEVIFGPIFKLTEAIFELIVPLLMANIIDVGIKNQDTGYIIRTSGLIILLGVLGYGCALLCQWMASVCSQGYGTVLRNELFSHINTLSFKQLDRLGTSSLIITLTNDINQMSQAVAMLIRLVVRSPFLAIGGVVMAFIINAKLAVIFLVATLLIALVLYVIMYKMVPYYRAIQKKLEGITALTRENLSGARVIRAFAQQQAQQLDFNTASNELAQQTMRANKLSSMINPLTSAIVYVSIVLILYIGATFIYDGALLQGEIVALVSYMTQILLALIVLSNLIVLFTKAAASAGRINQVFATQSDMVYPKTTKAKANPATPKLEFQDVSFSYGGGKSAVSGLNFCLNTGETLGIIGGTGSGKSTTLGLICRFYDVTSGCVRIDGIDVKNYAKHDLVQKIGIVPQHAVVLSGTVRKNMQLRCADADDKTIQTALQIAQASEFVEKLEHGYATFVSQGGKNLSGGQKQRLCIARALVGSPEIVLLDDSFSALDFATARNLENAIKQSLADTTVILVSQRINTIKNCDKILVLDDGKMVGFGTHESLLTQCEVYQEIEKTQQ